ncbi:PorP/SprF family type IX secretion system membrane protein [Aurantibacillus circumpalustris]|uniref:PorP/SprF family type IX secretion system membrane protein n=1 Tax=Aurantibacillus circumpalustris TaxID=3036359 RepID=UPI00295C115E|nr:PorP/SprF family type IX secretion system membrane protein [Aurantibacillus circumpalustris]
MKKLLLFTAAVLLLNNAYSQDQTLLNPNQSLIATNPSFAGSNGAFRNQLVARSTNPFVSNNNAVYYNALDGYIKKLHGGLAVSVAMNSWGKGAYRNSEINLVYAPIFECKETGFKIIPSIQFTGLKREVDIESLTFQQWGSSSTIQTPKKTNLEVSAGLLFNYKNFYAGGTIFHINQPDVGAYGQSRLPARFSFNASYSIPINQKTLINFASIFTKQNNFNSLLFTANAIFVKHLILGLGYSYNDSGFLNLGYRSNYFSVNLGYDVVLSKLAGIRNGGCQLALALSLHKKADNATLKSFEKW